MIPRNEVAIRFDVYECLTLALPAVAERLGGLVSLPLTRRRGAQRGEYYRWSGDDGADLLVQANLPDEEGQLLEPAAPVHAPLVYATGLPDHLHAALARVEGLVVLSSDVVQLASSPAPTSALPHRPDSCYGLAGAESDAAGDDREPLQVVR